MLTRVRGGESLRTPMSREEFRALGETKHHEYYDGLCIVDPPTRAHVLATTALARLLDEYCPEGLVAYQEWGWRTEHGEFQPDVMVAALAAPSEDQLEVPPLLVVELLSRSTCGDDLGVKGSYYAAAGAEWYWLVDLDVPEMLVLRNDAGLFVEAQRIAAGTPSIAVGPLPLPVDVRALVRRPRNG